MNDVQGDGSLKSLPPAYSEVLAAELPTYQEAVRLDPLQIQSNSQPHMTFVFEQITI